MADSLFEILHDGKYGYMNIDGVVVIKPQFLDAEGFRDGLAVAQDFNGRWGFIDTSGAWQVKPRYDFIGCGFSCGLAMAFLDDHYCCFDKNGTVQFEAPEDNMFGLSFCDDRLMVNIDGKFVFLDKHGDIVITTQFEKSISLSIETFSEGLAATRQGDLWGFIDSKGDWAIPPTYKSVDGFSEGLAAVTLVNKEKGYINKQGELCFSSRKWKYVEPFYNRLAQVWGKKPRTWGLINKEGKFVMGPFSIGKGGKISIPENNINLPGEVMEVAEWYTVFNDGLALVEVDGKQCFIDRNGNLVFMSSYDVWGRGFENGLCQVGLDDGWGYMDKTGKLVWEYHESITVSVGEKCTLPDDDADTFPIFAKYEELPEYLKSHISKKTFSKRKIFSLEVCVGGDRQGLLSMANTLIRLATDKEDEHDHVVDGLTKKSIGLVFHNSLRG